MIYEVCIDGGSYKFNFNNFFAAANFAQTAMETGIISRYKEDPAPLTEVQITLKRDPAHG